MGASISSEDSVTLEEVVVVSEEPDPETDPETYPTFVSAREMDWFWPFI